MNERIRELQSKSYLMCKQIVDDDGHVVVTTDQWIDKFAELLVRECISVMKSTVDESIDFERKLDETSSWIESDIKRHFGVEE